MSKSRGVTLPPLPLPGGAHGDTHSNTLYSRAVMVDSWHSGGVVSVA